MLVGILLPKSAGTVGLGNDAYKQYYYDILLTNAAHKNTFSVEMPYSNS